MKIYGIYMDRPLSQEETERFMSFISPENERNAGDFTIKKMLTAPCWEMCSSAQSSAVSISWTKLISASARRNMGSPASLIFLTPISTFRTPAAGSFVRLIHSRSALILKKRNRSALRSPNVSFQKQSTAIF